MILIKDKKTNEVREYYSLDDFIEDMCTDEMVMEWISEVMDYVHLYDDLSLPMGEIIYAYAKVFPNKIPYHWNDYVDDFISINAEQIREELIDNEENLIYFYGKEYFISGVEE